MMLQIEVVAQSSTYLTISCHNAAVGKSVLVKDVSIRGHVNFTCPVAALGSTFVHIQTQRGGMERAEQWFQ